VNGLYDISKKAKLHQECLYFDEYSDRLFEIAVKLQTEKLPGDLQDAEHLLVRGWFSIS
jgi:hypothetical protein